MPRQWTKEQRLAQAERIRAQKPWTCSTGPRTAEGKAVSSRNSLKSGYSTAARRDELYQICRFLRAQRLFMKKIVAEVRAAKAGRLAEMRKYRVISENELITLSLPSTPQTAEIDNNFIALPIDLPYESPRPAVMTARPRPSLGHPPA